MYRTFNMGVGMVIVCANEDSSRIQDHLKRQGEECYEIGEVIEGSGDVTIA
jgi:phosphoribosylformylglycinamidine cyclo-ligase